MSEKPDIQAALAALKEGFAKKIPAKIEEIDLGWERLQSAPEDKEIFDNLHRQAHTLAGTAATYGFEEIGQLSKEIESMLQGVFTADHDVWTEKSVHDLQRLIDNLKEGEKRIEKSVSHAEPEPEEMPSESGEITHRLIYLVDDDVDFLNTMEMQIQSFGYDVHAFSELAQFDRALEQEIPEVVIMDVMFGDSPRAGIEHVTHINAGRKYPLKTVFVTGSQDVLTRLDAVRANGLAYFPKPVLVEHLIDELDRITHKCREEAFRIVIVDDSVEQSAFAALSLQQAGMETREANDPLQLLNVLAEFPPDLILMDIYMPGCNGLELSRVVRQMEAYVSIPIVFLSAENDLKKQQGAMNLGGDDFLTKPVEPWYLVSAVTSRVQRGRMIRRLAETDGLTGLLTHTKSKERLEAELARAKRENRALSFAMLDIDHFKHVNDSYGHPAGDRVLKSLANMFKQHLRPYDTIGRYGGEEFVVILPNTDVRMAKVIMDKLRVMFSEISHFSDGVPFCCKFSCGVAAYPDFDTGAVLNDEADKALYVAKKGGRNLVVTAPHDSQDFEGR